MVRNIFCKSQMAEVVVFSPNTWGAEPWGLIQSPGQPRICRGTLPWNKRKKWREAKTVLEGIGRAETCWRRYVRNYIPGGRRNKFQSLDVTSHWQSRVISKLVDSGQKERDIHNTQGSDSWQMVQDSEYKLHSNVECGEMVKFELKTLKKHDNK